MTIDEILRRIVRAHLNTLLICALVPLAIVALVELRTPSTYTAAVRLQTLSSAPSSSTEAEGLSSRVLALATTPTVVQAALRQAGQPASSENAVDAATHRITAERLGESSVVVLSVLGDSPQGATRTVSALAQRVTRFMNQGSRERFDAALADVRARSAEALRRRDELQAHLSKTFGLQPRANLQTELSAAQNDLDQVLNEQSSLNLADVNRDQVVAVDATSPTVDRVASTLLPRAALAVLLGLLVGVALAVVMETLRPRIAGIRVLARTLDAPLLGATGDHEASLLRSMSLAARRQGVETVVLVGVDERDEKATRQLLHSMQASRQGMASPAGSVPAPQRAGGPLLDNGPGMPSDPTLAMSSQVHFTDRFGVTPAEEHTAGVVVISSGTTRRSSLDDVQDVIRAMRWPVIGVVEVTARRGWLAVP
jgi:hypothetical protein